MRRREKRKKRTRSAITIGVVGVIFIGVIVLLSVTGKKSKKAVSTNTSTTVSKTVPSTTTHIAGGTGGTGVGGPIGGSGAATPAGAVVPDDCVDTTPPKANPGTYKAPPPMTIDTSKTYVAHVATTCGTFDITLDAKVAPETVNSFVFLANNHFYDGLDFHRLVKDFVIQGGDPKGDGSGGPGYNLPTEPPLKGYQTGSVAMANAGAGTTGSQFFVTVSENGAKALGGPPVPVLRPRAGHEGLQRRAEADDVRARVRRTADSPALHLLGDDHGVLTASSRSATSPSASSCTAMPPRYTVACPLPITFHCPDSRTIAVCWSSPTSTAS